MAKLVRKYQAACDGSLHDSAKAADAHDLKAQRRKRLIGFFEANLPGDLTSNEWKGVDQAADAMLLPGASAVLLGIFKDKLRRAPKKVKKPVPAP